MKATNIGYLGKITIKKYRNGKLFKTSHIKNEGTARLFNLICIFLGSSNNTGYNKPCILDIVYGNNTSLLAEGSKPTCLTPTITTADPTSTNSASVTYTFTLYNNNFLIGGTSGASGVAQFALQNINGEILAYASTGIEASTINVSPNEVWVVNWELIIGNSSV